MPNYTKNYNFKKPLGAENYNVEDQNENWDKIDDKITILNGTGDVKEKLNKSDFDSFKKNNDSQLAEKAKQSDLVITNNVVALKANKSDVDTAIANMGSASPKGSYATLVALQTAFPTGTTGIYVVTTDGKWYYWNGSAWTAGGTYQSTEIGDDTVTSTKLSSDFNFRGILNNSNNLNAPLKTGVYMIRADISAPVNMPIAENGEPFILEHINVDANTVIQKTYNFTNPSKQWHRRLYGGTPTTWTTTYIPDTYIGTLTSANDLNDIINTGSYVVDSSVNSPFGTNGAVMSVVKSGNYIFQDITSLVTGERRYRAFDSTNKTVTGLTWKMIKNFFNNDIVAFLGDSITMGAGGTDDYVSKIPKRLNVKTINYGVSGTTIAYENIPEWDEKSFQERAKTIDLTGVKYLVIFGGTNDFNGGRPIGTNDSVVKTEFKGGLNLTIQTLLGRKADLQILLITPMWRNVGGNNSDTVPNSAGLYLRQYVEAVQDIAKKYKLPCFNLYDNCGINTYNETTWLRDGIHPTLDKGYDLLADKISAFLQGHI